MDETFGCPQCYGSEAGAMQRTFGEFAVVARLVDESHFSVSIVSCPHCGQQWVKIFTEQIDWADGEDPQQWCLLPISSQESGVLIAQGESLDVQRIETLGLNRRFFCLDWPKGPDPLPSWKEGGLTVGPHD